MKKNQFEVDLYQIIEKHQKTLDMQIMARMFLDASTSIYLNLETNKFNGLKKIILNLWNSIDKN